MGDRSSYVGTSVPLSGEMRLACVRRWKDRRRRRDVSFYRHLPVLVVGSCDGRYVADSFHSRRSEALSRWRRKRSTFWTGLYRHLPISVEDGGRCGGPKRQCVTDVRGSTSGFVDCRTLPSSSRTTRVVRRGHGKSVLSVIVSSPDVLTVVPRCRYCLAYKFVTETDNFCCSNGRVSLVMNEIPVVMQQLLICNSDDGKVFRQYIRMYNNHFAFTSLGVHVDTRFTHRNQGVYTFRVKGQVYHFLQELQPGDTSAKNLELYFHDTENEIENRLAYSPCLRENLLRICRQYLECNPYALFFKSLSQISDLRDYNIVLRTIPCQDQRVYNKPTVSQVAAVWVDGQDGGDNIERSIQVKTHDNVSRNVNFYYGCYDPLQYPLMFPYGDLGWHQHIPKKRNANCPFPLSGMRSNLPSLDVGFNTSVDELLDNEATVLQTQLNEDLNVSVREYYAYKLQMRPNDKSFILHFGRLFQQYVVDNYVKLETQRLTFLKTQQKDIRQEFYNGIVDAMAQGETSASAIGKRIILPANFIGGPRNMRRRYVDAMTLVQKFGKPDIFLTITCNPSWPEITDHLLSYEEAQNRPDLTSRVFHAKIEVLKDEILKKQIFGDVSAYTYVIEFQKRGLPHAHFLIILKPTSKMYSPAEYDEIVSAEIPNKHDNPYLYNLVKNHMIHGPCGYLNPDNVCMKIGRGCKNFYPKEFAPHTTESPDAYPIYRRRDDGSTVFVRGATLDNKWVVPYSPYLLAKFNCHVNVEICSSIKATKYIYKYICKGCDKISFSIADNSNVGNCDVQRDEIEHFQSARWISPPEGAWRLFRFSLGEIKPAVIHLPLHLENYQPVTFTCRSNLKSVLNNSSNRKTMLTEFFANNRHSNYAQSLNLTYAEYPDHFVWKSNKKWQPRTSGDSIGRIVIAHPSEGPRYFLRVLLLRVRCPKSYEDLKTFNGHVVDSFRESALIRGFLLDDNTQRLCLEEASGYHLPYALRQLFSTLLVYDPPNNPRELWQQFEYHILEDFVVHQKMTMHQGRISAFKQIKVFLDAMGRNIEEFDLITSDISYVDLEDNVREVQAEMSLIVSEDDMNAITLLNPMQKVAFDTILTFVNNNVPGAFFLDGPGGTGKTFLYRALLAHVRSSGNIALAVATSGIAASLLPGGRTAHSRFKIPLDMGGNLQCNMSKQSSAAMLIKRSKLIIWDEAPMAKRFSIECLDALLKDLMDSNHVFGGKTVVLGGDFRQTLPVIRKGSKNDTISACMTNSPLWPLLIHLKLTDNMRASVDPYFTDFLLRVGNGCNSDDDDSLITLPETLLITSSFDVNGLDRLIDYVFPNFMSNSFVPMANMNRALLTTKNTFVDEINEVLINRFSGQQFDYYSTDTTNDQGYQAQYEDLLHSLTPNGMPAHKLSLKKNAPIILLRNLNPTEGLCNGTRLICKDFKRNVIHAQIAVGDFTGKEVFIHRIPLSPPTGENYVVPFKRIQFPVRLCFAMTINKAQGQTLDFVGIYLKEPVFSHGQLYVALSRAKKMENIKVYIKESASIEDHGTTNNIVYKDVLEKAYST